MKSSLLLDLTLCSQSEVFAGIIWDYKKIYNQCSTFSDCACVFNSSCSDDIIPLMYKAFSCNGLCNTGEIPCDSFLSSAISKVSLAFVLALILGFILLVFSFILFLCLIRSLLVLPLDLNIQEKNLSNLEGITVQLDSCSIHQFPPEISAIRNQSYMSADDSQIIIQ